MTDKSQAALDLCRTKSMAFVATVAADGKPQVTPVWVDVLDGKPAFNTAVGRAKERHLRNDPRISLAITDPENPYSYIEIQGTATLTEDGADDFIDALAKKYINEDTYPWRSPTETRITVLIEPEKILGMQN
jgi:PPOX class probable F420-dependent enzyme